MSIDDILANIITITHVDKLVMNEMFFFLGI